MLRTLLNVIRGATTPIEISGKAYLKQLCTGYGIDVGNVPEMRGTNYRRIAFRRDK